MSKLEDRFWDKVDKGEPSACWMWTASGSKEGYGHFGVAGKILKAHRVSWELANGEIPDGSLVRHHCDRPGCVNPSHLFLGTDADNMADRNRKGRAADKRGVNNGRAKLTEDDIRKIRHLYASSDEITLEILGRRFGVSFVQISSIVNRKQWRHIP